MAETLYLNRRAVQIENDQLRVTVLVEGGHIAEILHKATGVNPLWTPPWPSIEPSTYDPARHPGYGLNVESSLLSGIMGHNLCLDLFGGPTAEEAAAGIPVHGEASVLPFTIHAEGQTMTAAVEAPGCRLRFERLIELAGSEVLIAETVENLAPLDRAIGWTQHVTLGAPFVDPGVTRFQASATRSKVFESAFGDHGYMTLGAEFEWPNAPLAAGGVEDMRTYTNRAVSGAFTTHLMDPRREESFFEAWSPASGVLCGYRWRRSDFPWLGIWEENRSRAGAPWNSRTITRGMEFGVSPMPESRRAMIDRGSLFGVPGYRWIPARTKVEARYRAYVTTAAGL